MFAYLYLNFKTINHGKVTKTRKQKNLVLQRALGCCIYRLPAHRKKIRSFPGMGGVISFLPTITFGMFIYNYIKGVGAMDEVQRRIQLEAVVWAFSLGLLLMMTLGLLDFVVTLKKEDWGYTHIIPYLFLFYFFGIFISRRKYN